MIGELIQNFENSALEIGNGEIQKLVAECIPPEHLEGIPFIKFDPTDEVFLSRPDILGYYDPANCEIHVNEHGWIEGHNGIKETVLHEIGHNAQIRIFDENPVLRDAWEDMYQSTLTDPGAQFVSDYAAQSMAEDFSECYACYRLDPDRLAALCPEKYDFMRHYVFHEAGHCSPPFGDPWKAFEDFVTA